MASRRRGSLPYVERHGSGFRGWWIDQAGVRKRGPTRPTAQIAYDDATRARRRVAAPGPVLTIGGACELVLREAETRQRSAGTLEWYDCQRIAVLRYFRAEDPLDALTVAELQAFIAQRLAGTGDGVGGWKIRPVSSATVDHHLRFLRRLFRLAVRHGWAGEVPIAKVVAPAVPAQRPDVFGWDEARDLICEVRAVGAGNGGVGSHRDADVLELLLRTGLRRSELARLRPEDVDLGAKLLHVRGKRGPRTVPLSNEAVECVKRIPSLAGSLTIDPRQYTPDHISRIFRRWRVRLREPRLHPHAFRHTFATRLVDRGVPLATVARLLGHAPGSYGVTLRYYAASEPALRQAVELL
jgi:integrase